jgi:hypothetical protein
LETSYNVQLYNVFDVLHGHALMIKINYVGWKRIR